jgi:hypothetical protein
LPFFKSLCFLTKLSDQLLKPLFKALLFRDNLVLRFLYVVPIFRRMGALELEFCLRTLNPRRDVGSFNGTYAINLLHIAPLYVERSGKPVGSQLRNVARVHLRDTSAPDWVL